MSESSRSADPASSPAIDPRVDRALHPRPRAQLSLRGRLIVVGVLVVTVMGGAYWYYRSTAPARAAEAIEAAGGSVRYAKDQPSSGVIVAVDLSLPELSDEQLAVLPLDAFHLPDVTRLDLRNTAITDGGLVQLEGMRLQTLLLDNTAVTDAGLETLLELPSLESVSLSHTLLSNAGLDLLAQLPELHSLYLAGTRVTAAGLPVLARCGALQYLQLDAAQAQAGEASQLKQSLPNLVISVTP